ncbi:MAG: NAD(P)H-binding protein [Hyphomicrobiaceae bacterium]
MATVLVVGASRGIGLETVRLALEAGHEVRALARSAADIPGDDTRLTRIAASALDQGAVGAALAGADAVLMTLGEANPMRATRLFSDATRVLIDAMKEKGVRRLVVVTGLGAGDSRGHGGFLYDFVFFPIVLSRIYADKDVQERMVRNSGLDWTIVRPGVLTRGRLTRRYKVLIEPREWRSGSISRADVADFLVGQITDRSLLGKTPLLVN